MGTKKPLIVSVLGWSDSGKTSLIEAAIAECVLRSIPTAALKKSHNAASLQPDTKDSSRFLKAGAEPSIYLSESEILILKKAPSRIDKKAIAALCPDAFIIFCEGLEVEGAIRVLAAGDATDEKELKRRLTDIDILIARNAALLTTAIGRKIKSFKPDGINPFIDYLIVLEGSHD